MIRQANESASSYIILGGISKLTTAPGAVDQGLEFGDFLLRGTESTNLVGRITGKTHPPVAWQNWQSR